MSFKRHRLPPLLEAALQLEAEKGLSRLFLPSISVNQTQEHSMNPTNADLATDITTNCTHVVSTASTTTPLVEGVDRSQISDGYHTFAELYDHRHSLMLALMRALPSACWFSQRHSDGDLPFGSADWFIVGAELPTGAITYHLPIELLSLARQTGAVELSAGRPWDGHTAHDVIERLRAWAASSQPTLARFAHQPVPPAEGEVGDEVMINEHPITPLPELVEEWIAEIWHEGTPVRVSASDIHVATQAARWGADQELEECVNYVDNNMSGNKARRLRAIRRPKPPGLKEQVKAEVNRLIALVSTKGALSMAEPIRCALEQLDALPWPTAAARCGGEVMSDTNHPPLSPEAQAVLDAAHEAWVTKDDPGSIAAAALCAAADQIVPEQSHEGPFEYCCDYTQFWQKDIIRRELLGIAKELEGHHG